MKKITILPLSILLSITTMGNDNQDTVKNELDIFYYSTHIGSNISIDYNMNFTNHSIIAGLKYHINPRIRPSGAIDYAYYKKFYADNFARHWGITLGYEYHIKDINPFVSPYLFYNLQCSYMKIRRDRVFDSATSGLLIQQYKYGPYLSLENTIGAGLSIKLTDNFNLNQSAGIGAAFFIDNGNPKTINTWHKNGNYNWTWDSMYLLRLGLTYKL